MAMPSKPKDAAEHAPPVTGGHWRNDLPDAVPIVPFALLFVIVPALGLVLLLWLLVLDLFD